MTVLEYFGINIQEKQQRKKRIKYGKQKNLTRYTKIQNSVINGEYQEVPNYYNFFDTVHDENTQTYMGEDYGFCKLWTDIGGKIYALTDKYIMHVGEHQYIGRYMDEFEKAD